MPGLLQTWEKWAYFWALGWLSAEDQWLYYGGTNHCEGSYGAEFELQAKSSVYLADSLTVAPAHTGMPPHHIEYSWSGPPGTVPGARVDYTSNSTGCVDVQGACFTLQSTHAQAIAGGDIVCWDNPDSETYPSNAGGAAMVNAWKNGEDPADGYEAGGVTYPGSVWWGLDLDHWYYDFAGGPIWSLENYSNSWWIAKGGPGSFVVSQRASAEASVSVTDHYTGNGPWVYADAYVNTASDFEVDVYEWNY